MFDCVFCGTATYDILFLVDTVPKSDQRIAASKLMQCGGGPAATACVAFGSLGKKALLMSAVGDDFFGKLIINELDEKGIDTSGIQVIANQASSVSGIHIEKATGKRAITYSGGCLKAFDLKQINKEVLHNCKSVHLDGNHFDLVFTIAKYCHEHTEAVVSLDGGNMPRENIMRILPYVDIFIPDNKTTHNALGETDFKEACSVFFEMGPRIVCITLGEEGSIAYDGEKYYTTPAYPVDVVDTTGAGDNFHGAFMYGYLSGWALEDVLKFAGAYAALTCQGLGGRERAPSVHEAEKLIKG